jgi:hypothetical protein
MTDKPTEDPRVAIARKWLAIDNPYQNVGWLLSALDSLPSEPEEAEAERVAIATDVLDELARILTPEFGPHLGPMASVAVRRLGVEPNELIPALLRAIRPARLDEGKALALALSLASLVEQLVGNVEDLLRHELMRQQLRELVALLEWKA